MSRIQHKSTKLETAKSLASSFQTDWINISFLTNCGFIMNCNSVTDNTGTFAVEVRSKKSENEVSDPVELTLSSTPTLADADADLAIDLANVPYDQIRLTFTPSAGSPDGDADIWLTTKGGA